jgi:hypothetical protein
MTEQIQISFDVDAWDDTELIKAWDETMANYKAKDDADYEEGEISDEGPFPKRYKEEFEEWEEREEPEDETVEDPTEDTHVIPSSIVVPSLLKDKTDIQMKEAETRNGKASDQESNFQETLETQKNTTDFYLTGNAEIDRLISFWYNTGYQTGYFSAFQRK